MPNLAQFTNSLLIWYTQRARPFFAEMLPPEKMAEFDREGEQLQTRLQKLDTELVVCFLGSSGVGKSTLLNAIVDGQQALVPSGGVGPLTAQALSVRYAPQPKLKAEYHGLVMLHRTYFGLEQMYKVELGAPIVDVTDEAIPDNLDDSDLADIGPVATSKDESVEATADSESEEKRQQWRRRAQLLITGAQDRERPIGYLVDCLRETVGQPRKWGTIVQQEDEKQLQSIKQVLSRMKDNASPIFEMDSTQDPEVFKRAVHDHAVGFMAPLIKNLTVYWPAPALQQGLTLVDLPGVGILSDAHKEVTRGWIREKAKALVLVVDHRGITDAVAKALHQTEFLNSLLYSIDEPDEDPIVIVAVTRIDDTANDRYTKDKSKRKAEHFLEIAQEVQQRMRLDLQRQLESIWLQATDVTEARQQVVRNLLSTLQVHPISAPEYARLLEQDEENKAFLKTLEQTGIPGFIQSLNQLGDKRTLKLYERLNEFARAFRDSLSAQLRLIESQWEDQKHAREEAEKLRQELLNFSEPLREELNLRRGAYREFLKTGIPDKIKDLVSLAGETASRDIEKYMQHIGTAHWATLRASVRRGGAYRGAMEIDLPNQFALRFEEPIADAWSKKILVSVRARTREYGNDCLELAGNLRQWATKQGARVRVKAVNAQYEALQANARKFEAVGREMARDMREEAKARLVEAIEKKIKQACNEFVSKNSDVGPGVKGRILGLYHDLAGEVASIAKDPALKLLQKVYRDAEVEIQEALADFQDPLTPIGDAIVASEEQRIARSDAEKREIVLTQLRVLLADLPELPDSAN